VILVVVTVLVVGSLPAEGIPLRVGQLLALTVRDEPEPPMRAAAPGAADLPATTVRRPHAE
jgi:hypothetical protein